MRRSYEDYQPNNQYGYSNISSHDYHDHISRLARMPSAVVTDVPRFGFAPRFFNTAKIGGSYGETEAIREEHDQKKHHKKHQHPTFEEKVEIFEYEKAEDVANRTSTSTINSQVVEDNTDTEANSYIQQKRKGFGLVKWKTFTPH